MIANQSTKEKITGLFINCEGRQRGEHCPSLKDKRKIIVEFLSDPKNFVTGGNLDCILEALNIDVYPDYEGWEERWAETCKLREQETEIDNGYEPEYTKNMFLQLVRIDVLVCTWHAGFLTATLVFDAIEEDDTRIHNYFTNGMSFAEVESNDMRIGDFFDAYPYDFGDALHVDYENRKRTRNLPQWQPPTRCPKCGGELQSQFGDIVCKTVFETGTH